MKRIVLALSVAISTWATTASLAGQNSIMGEHAWARATPRMAVTGGGYLTGTNRGPGEDRLLNATHPVAEKIQFHSMTIDNGVAKMTQLSAIELPPGVPVVFKTGGIHMMLLGLKHQLKEGETVPLTLTFEKAGPVDVEARVLGIGATGDAGNQASSGN